MKKMRNLLGVAAIFVTAMSFANASPGDTAEITINKYIDGVQATALNASSTSFPMYATYTIGGTPGGPSAFAIDVAGFNSPNSYEAITGGVNIGDNYSTYEDTTGSVVGSACVVGTSTPAFALTGYTTGSTSAIAQAGTPSMTVPNFVGLTGPQYVIVWNEKCAVSTGGGEIGGDVSGGVSTSTGVLSVTSVDVVDNTATADGTFENGWKYTFNITVPTNENQLQMKFADWTSLVGSTTIPVANNVRISSLQANNANATVMVTAANTYTLPTLTMNSDMNLSLAGLQVQVLVEAAVPSNTVNGAYATNYGVKTQ